MATTTERDPFNFLSFTKGNMHVRILACLAWRQSMGFETTMATLQCNVLAPKYWNDVSAKLRICKAVSKLFALGHVRYDIVPLATTPPSHEYTYTLTGAGR